MRGRPAVFGDFVCDTGGFIVIGHAKGFWRIGAYREYDEGGSVRARAPDRAEREWSPLSRGRSAKRTRSGARGETATAGRLL